MDKKIIIIAVVISAVLIVAVAAGYFYFKSKNSNVFERASDAAEKITEDATRGVLPSLETNPLSDKPDTNPAAAANPIKNIKTNPFE